MTLIFYNSGFLGQVKAEVELNVKCCVALEKTSLILNAKSSELTENKTITSLTFGL